ncbi:MAG: hypothetical protein HYT03_02905 [Candidatus Harrisonbacteria bacterium]|nr:hypothetical protein [Candidatus Harrisonbacteria bacterium]
MEVGDAIEGMISPVVSEGAVFKQALKQGMVTMQQDGILKVMSGVTTFDEVENLTGPLRW